MPHNFTKNFAKKLKNLDKNTCILFSDLVYYLSVRELSSVGRATALQAVGHRFEPCSSHHDKDSADEYLCGNGSVVERHLAKVNVAGSNLVSRSNLFIRTIFFIYAAL